ncbi:molybdopterin biosynthesis protein MoeA [Clostridium aceticum]|uniref:Molybdopterin molybdenumtransferase n=2 Tax=Clostridium aceticum TaxID=84022 RepID=A0A0D8IEL2_9CLOT|nr:gephyrin-like molybdotransferase Glp [Clostridium aceticum]AKL94360.1 molybdopterin biosynthesis protein MoeA [Clostridium aceticum]KJF28407.1 molybdenum cofactor biosynthesis protein [Clostridium aceticum]
MIKISEAINIITKEAKLLEVEKVHILSSLNKILAEDIYSKDNLPSFDKSAMDGYAIKSEDTKNCESKNPVELRIKGIIKAGDYYEEEIKCGEAIKIMTGAAVPRGANAVIEIEKVNTVKDKLILNSVVKKENNIIKMGEEIEIGDLAIQKGKMIRPAEIGLLASLGYKYIHVYKSPVISLIITGDELIEIDEEPFMGKIRNSNEYSLRALIDNLNGKYISLGVVSDDKNILKEKIKYAFENSDIVITSGGASVGDYDFIEDVLKELGADIKFTTISIKPGKPVTFAVYNEKLFFGLPGNPMSIITAFEEFVVPAVNKMMGKNNLVKEEITVVLADDFKGKKGRTKYVYADIIKENGRYYAYNVGSQCSNHLITLSRANGIVIIPADIGSVNKGEILNGKFIFK